MIFVLDIGNTRTKTAFFEGEKHLKAALTDHWTLYDLQTWLASQKVDGIIWTASGPVPEGVEAWLQGQASLGTKVLYFDHLTRVPVRNAYRSPETLGKDRLAAVVGAQALFPEQNCLVIDTGTCTTYNLLSAEAFFLGGNITPGIDMRLRAMHHFTSRLPLVPRHSPGEVMGTDTVSSLHSGALEGAVFEMEGFIRYYSGVFEALQLILTGGDAALFYSRLSRRDIHVAPDLVLWGLKEIYYYQ